MKFQSILINSASIITIENLEKFLKENSQLPGQIKPTNSLEISALKNSIGIAQLKEITEWINLKSFNTKFVVIQQAETLTPEAQNSLLKNLEEPPENTLFILISKNREKILETIRSRCIELFYKDKKEERTEYLNISENFLKSDYLEKIKTVEKLAKDYDSREELADIIFEIIIKLSRSGVKKEKIKIIENIYIGIKSGVNLKLCLDLLAIYTI